MYRKDAPLIVQSDGSLLLEVASPDAPAARDALVPFAELVKSPEHVHTYRITSLSLWNAAGAGVKLDDVLGSLSRFSKYDIPQNVAAEIREAFSRFGRLILEKDGGSLRLRAADDVTARQIAGSKRLAAYLGPRQGDSFLVAPEARGLVKQSLIHAGWPVDDKAGFADGAKLDVELREVTKSGRPFGLRPYQAEAVRAFVVGGHGVVVLPCGAGKTVTAMAAMVALKCNTLILCTSASAVHQWVREIEDKTNLTADQIGTYTANKKQLRPVTVTTYSMLVQKAKAGAKSHMQAFEESPWGFIIYDEVHMLPAPLFRLTAELQARRRLGLTATLVREDGKEPDVFSLIGPKRYDVPWKQMEESGWVARASCVEVRVPMPTATRIAVATAEDRRLAYRLAAENPIKFIVLKALVDSHANDRILVVGQYRSQVCMAAKLLNAPVVTGETSDAQREALYEAFRQGEVRVLVASKVANFSIDIPDANVLIQLSGAFGSRQEEAQRLGRILRPKDRPATMYSLVSHDSDEQRFAVHRQMFLAEQGYRYTIEDWNPSGPVDNESAYKDAIDVQATDADDDDSAMRLLN